MSGKSFHRTLKILLLVVSAASCGRIGFDPFGSDPDGVPADHDAGVGVQDAAALETDAALPSLADPTSLAGVWTTQMLSSDEDGSLIAIPRATDGDGVLGDFELRSTGPTTFAFKSSSAFLNGNEAITYNRQDGDIEIQPDDMWLLTTNAGNVVVLRATLDGDALSLIWQDSDPRNLGSLIPPVATHLRFNPGYTAASAGNWTSLTLEYRDGDVFTPTGCVDQGGGVFERVVMEVHIDSILRMSANLTSSRYSEPNCLEQIGMEVETWTGLAEETGTGYEIWANEQSTSDAAYWNASFAIEGVNLRIDTWSCLPMPGCLSLTEKLLLAPLEEGS